MTWIVFALLTAFCESFKDVFSKKGLARLDEYVIAWALRFFALPFLLPLLFFIKMPPLGPGFWLALVVGAGLNAVCTILYMKAIKQSALSLTVPLVALTPMFLLLTSPLMIGEFPDWSGVFGIVLIVMGSYVLNLNASAPGYFAPFRALLKEPGPKLMLLTAFLWSLTANFDKIGIQNSSPLFWSLAAPAGMALVLMPVMLYKSPRALQQIPVILNKLVPIGFFAALTVIFQMLAVSLTLVSHVIAIKRTSTILSVCWGHLLFNEGGIKERLLGASIMVLGVVLISLF
ncbi:MAG: hypothetical protein ALAOOOJD_02871 [bacterium]|nr:hypothetical protein [bacterium]